MRRLAILAASLAFPVSAFCSPFLFSDPFPVGQTSQGDTYLQPTACAIQVGSFNANGGFYPSNSTPAHSTPVETLADGRVRCKIDLGVVETWARITGVWAVNPAGSSPVMPFIFYGNPRAIPPVPNPNVSTPPATPQISQ